MSWAECTEFAARHWRTPVEIGVLALAFYSTWLIIRAVRGARLLVSLAVALLAITLLSQLMELKVLSWLLRSLSTFLALALVILFQPELRRALAALGNHRLLSLVAEPEHKEVVGLLADTTFDLANRQLGALIAIQREDELDDLTETGVSINSEISTELLVTIFHAKTPLHDGGVIICGDRLVSAASIFPITQRHDLDRNLGLRHRAGLGLTEEYDAVVIVVSEETGIVSICHRGTIERNLDPEAFTRRLGELLASPSANDASAVSTSAREDRVARPRRGALDGHQKEHRDDRLAF